MAPECSWAYGEGGEEGGGGMGGGCRDRKHGSNATECGKGAETTTATTKNSHYITTQSKTYLETNNASLKDNKSVTTTATTKISHYITTQSLPGGAV